MFVTHPAYIREKARQMRIEKDLTIDEIAERLAISRQTIFYCVRDARLKKPRRTTAGQRMCNKATRCDTGCFARRRTSEASKSSTSWPGDPPSETSFR
jgi:hypothetical protein